MEEWKDGRVEDWESGRVEGGTSSPLAFGIKRVIKLNWFYCLTFWYINIIFNWV